MKFEIKNRDIDLDDGTLIYQIQKTEDIAYQRKKLFNEKMSICNKDDYIDVKLARLAYWFAKEEFEDLSAEAKKRGLIII